MTDRRLVGVDDHTDPRLPQSVINATVGTGPNDVAAGDTLAAAMAYADSVAGGGGGTTGPLVTSTTVSSTVNPSALNQLVTFNAAVTSAGLPVTTGVIAFRRSDQTDPFAFVLVNGIGQASVTTAALTGSPNITAAYQANAMALGSTSPPVTQVVISPPVTATVLTSSDDSITYGSPVTFTATVKVGLTPVNTGTVTFKRGALNMASGLPVNASGVASFTIGALPVGSWPITAVYDGGTVLQPSTSNVVTQDVLFAGGPAATSGVLTSDDATSNTGQLVTFTMTVTKTSDATPVASGTVTFRDGATTVASNVAVDPVTGTAVYTNSTFTAGTHTISAVYTGAPVYANVTSNSVAQVVTVATGTASIAQAISCSRPPVSVVDELVVFRTTVLSNGNPPGWTGPDWHGPAVGTVVFKDNGVLLGPGNPINLYGESFYVTADLAVGTHNITAEYTGLPAYEDDVSTVFVQQIVATATDPGTTWSQAFNSGSLPTITAWYDFNTGYLTEGFTRADLWNPAGVGAIDKVIVTDAWLTANAAAGKVVNDGGGHWTITGLHTTAISARRSHLTFNHCWIDRQDYAHEWGAGFDVYDPALSSPDLVNLEDFTLNRCTFTTDGSGTQSTFGDVMYYNPAPALYKNDALVFNNCEVSMWTAAFKMVHSATINYCWVHDLDLFGFDPHNTSASIRGSNCRVNRSLLCDGTSSSVSLYSDYNPHTDFWVNENVLWVLPYHASFEVNFPERGTGFTPLVPGYIREFTDNRLQRGAAGDLQWFTKVSGNRLITGEPLFGGADTVQVPTVPTLLAGPSTGQGFGASQSLVSWHYTPSPSSRLLLFHALGRAGTSLDPNIAIADESGLGWTIVPGCETPVELSNGGSGAGPVIYGLSASLWTQQTSSATQDFRRITIDPYQSRDDIAYMSANVVEITGKTSLTLAQPAVQSASGHQNGFNVSVNTVTSGTLAAPATSGNLVMLFVGWNHEARGGLTAPDGWNILGNNVDTRSSSATMWRKDFTGRSVTVPSMGPQCSVVVTILVEIVMP